MLIQKFAAVVVAALALLMTGCASGPQTHVDACKAIATDAVSSIECVQERMRADPSTPEGVQARIDFMVVAARSLNARVGSGAITRDEARSAFEALGRELDGAAGLSNSTAYVSPQTLDVLGLPSDTMAFNRYVQPSPSVRSGFKNLATGSASGLSVDPAPCVAGSCGPVSVKGYYRKDGTYVRPHTRASPGTGRGRR